MDHSPTSLSSQHYSHSYNRWYFGEHSLGTLSQICFLGNLPKIVNTDYGPWEQNLKKDLGTRLSTHCLGMKASSLVVGEVLIDPGTL